MEIKHSIIPIDKLKNNASNNNTNSNNIQLREVKLKHADVNMSVHDRRTSSVMKGGHPQKSVSNHKSISQTDDSLPEIRMAKEHSRSLHIEL